jgi:hypothetical protein
VRLLDTALISAERGLLHLRNEVKVLFQLVGRPHRNSILHGKLVHRANRQLGRVFQVTGFAVTQDLWLKESLFVATKV